MSIAEVLPEQNQPESRPQSLRRPDLLKVLNKNPKYKYRWVNYEAIRQSGGIHRNGWRLLTNASKSEESIVKEHSLQGINWIDGCVRLYEMALAFMPIAEWQELKTRKDWDAECARNAMKQPTPGLDPSLSEYKRWR